MSANNNSFDSLSVVPSWKPSSNNNQSYEIVSNNVTSKPNQDPLISLKVPAIMFASGVFGNILAILVLARSSRDHKQTVFYRLVGALAVTDLFGTCATSPVTLAVYANNLKWVGGHHLCNYESFMFVFVSCTTIFIIGTMAIDRVFAVSFPFFYERNLTFSRAKFYIIGLWGVAALMGSLPLIGLGEVKNQFPGSWCFFTFTSEKLKNQIYAYGYACIGLFMICLTGVANIIVTLFLLKMRRAAARTMGNTKRNDSELQMMVLLLGVMTVFATCWCPFLIRILINQANFRQVDDRADLHALRLASLNQILDPWVYILFRREFFKRIYAFVRQKIFGRSALCFTTTSVSPSSTQRAKARCHAVKYGQTADAHAQDGLNEHMHVLLDQQNSCFHDNDIANNARTQSYESNESSFRSEGNSNLKVSEEAMLVMPARGRHSHRCHGLDLKHSACLFCFANHPRNIALSNMENSRSLGKIDFPNSNLGQERTAESVDVYDPLLLKYAGKGKRKSIHLSLEDLRR